MKKADPHKSKRTRQFIVETAASIFNKKGIAGTSLSDLTAATGLTKGSIYGNFKDKHDVAVSVFKYNVDNLTRFLEKEIAKGNTAVEKLLAIPNAYKKLYKHMIAFGGCPILNTAVEADDTDKKLCRLTAETVGVMKERISGLLKSGKKTGEIRDTVNTDKTADIIIALIEGGIFLSKLTGKKDYFINSAEQIETLIQTSSSTG